MPTVLSVVIIGFIWQLILNPLWGVSEGILKSIGLGALYQPWLGAGTHRAGDAVADLRVAVRGHSDAIVLRGLDRHPGRTPRSGTRGWLGSSGIFWRVKFPLILPTVGTWAILTFVGNFNAFDLIYTVKGGLAGPNFASDIMGTLFYRTFFGFQRNWAAPPWARPWRR